MWDKGTKKGIWNKQRIIFEQNRKMIIRISDGTDSFNKLKDQVFNLFSKNKVTLQEYTSLMDLMIQSEKDNEKIEDVSFFKIELNKR